MRKIMTASTALALAALASPALTSPALAKTGGVGWQAVAGYTVPTGETDLFIHYDCPTGYSVEDGGFQATSTAQGNGFVLSGNGPRLDISPANYGEWAWNFKWPNGGAPAGSILALNIYCKKGAP